MADAYRQFILFVVSSTGSMPMRSLHHGLYVDTHILRMKATFFHRHSAADRAVSIVTFVTLSPYCSNHVKTWRYLKNIIYFLDKDIKVGIAQRTKRQINLITSNQTTAKIKRKP